MTTTIWRLADAKNRFSELVTRTLTEGPQRVRRRNDEVVIISAEEYAKLTGERPTFKSFLMQPAGIDELDMSRDRSTMREVEL